MHVGDCHSDSSCWVDLVAEEHDGSDVEPIGRVEPVHRPVEVACRIFGNYFIFLHYYIRLWPVLLHQCVVLCEQVLYEYPHIIVGDTRASLQIA